MKLDDITSATRDTVSARRVFGDPVERDGVALLPAATITGGGGGGGGHDATGQEGEGGGLGVRARPAGAYVVNGSDVHWQPAVDVNRIITVVGAVAITYLLARTHLEAVRSRTERRSRRR